MLRSTVGMMILAHVTFAQPPNGGNTGSTTCDVCGSSATYAEAIELTGIAKRVITTSGCPNHYSVCTGKSGVSGCGGVGTEGSASEATVRDKSIEIPAYPVLASSPTSIECTMGEVATALNGVSIYSGAVDTSCTAVDVDDSMSEWTGFDMCSGHATGDGDYHYHFPPSCLHDQAMATNPTNTGHSPQLGWAWDGFPIYGPLYTGGVYITQADLDECSGKEEELPEIDQFKYRYYLTGATSDLYALPGNPKPANSDYPFTLKCYRGCTYDQMSNGGCTGSTSDGFNSTSYNPTALAGYAEPFANYGTSGSNFNGDTYTSAFLSDGVCDASGGGSTTTTSPPPPPPPDTSANDCFPSSAMVRLADGSALRMDALTEGDAILAVTPEGKLTSKETVSLLSIAKPDAASSFVTLSTEAGARLVVTKAHHMPVGAECCSQLKPAAELRPGEQVWLVTEDETLVPSTINAVGEVEAKGLHSPVLTSGSLPVVDGFVTSYDSIDKVRLARYGLMPLLALCKATGTCASLRGLFQSE